MRLGDRVLFVLLLVPLTGAIASLTAWGALPEAVAVVGGTLALVAVVIAYRSTHKSRDLAVAASGSEQLILWSVRLFVPLMAMSYYTRGVSIAVLLALTAVPALTHNAAGRSSLGFATVPIMLVTAIGWSTGDTGIRGLLGIVALSMLAIALSRLRQEMFVGVFQAAFDSVAIYLLISIVGHFVGLESPSALNRSGVLASSVPFFDERVVFPFTTGINTPGAMAAAYLSAYLCTLHLSFRGRDLFRLTSAVVAVFVLAASASRFPIIAACLVGVSVYLSPRSVRTYAVPLALLMLLLPLWWPPVSSLARPLLEPLASSTVVSRDQGEVDSLVSLQGRTGIWDATVRQFRAAALWNIAFGFGPSGQSRWNASLDYLAAIRSVGLDPAISWAHNSLLQQLVDSGLVGAGLLLLVITRTWLAVRRIHAQLPTEAILVAASMLLALCFTAGTESTLAVTIFQETGWLFLVLLVLVDAYDAALRSTPPVAATRERSPQVPATALAR